MRVKKAKPVSLRKYNTRARAQLLKQIEAESQTNKFTYTADNTNNFEMATKANMFDESSSGENTELNNLIKLLTLKIQREEEDKNKPNISIECFGKIVPDFDGATIPVIQWFDNFDKNAEAYELNEKQKYVQARNKMTGAAKLFLEAVSVCDYFTLKEVLMDEFHKVLSSAEVHKQLSNRKKMEGESFHEYVLHMRKLAAAGNIEDVSIIRYIVDGLRIKSEFKYSFYNAKSFKELREQYSIYERIKPYEQPNKNKPENKQFNINNNKKEHCFNCGSADHKRKDCKEQTKCFSCNKTGHIAKNCILKIQKTNSYETVNLVIDKKRLKTIYFNNIPIDCLIDTGSDVTLIKESVYEQNFKDCDLKQSSSLLFGLGNVSTEPLGYVNGTVCVDSVKTIHNFLVVPDKTLKYNALLGYDFISKFKFSSNGNGYEFQNQIDLQNGNDFSVYNITTAELDVPLKYKDEVVELVSRFKPSSVPEKVPIIMKIVPDGKLKPFRHSPSRFPINEQEAVRKQVADWLADGTVRTSSSSVASRLVVVKKKSGDYRVCVDFRQLNKMVLKDCFPVPLIDEVLEKLQSSKFFTIMDLENGFFHVPIEESSKHYTAFVTKDGLFEFNKAPFGFCNSPANFIRYVSYIFQPLINNNVMELYMDDIVIYDKTPEGCLNKLKIVLNTAARFNLKIKWSKCSFMQSKIDFLGHIVEGGMIWPGKEKTKAIDKFPQPKSIKDVQSFLGITGYFRRFIEGYAQIARPLTNLLKKDSKFIIGEEELKAIHMLKMALVKEPVLKIYDRMAETELHTDASKHGFGAALLQRNENHLHPVFFWSKKTSPQEQSQHSYILEVKAAYLAFKKFRHYLLGINFKLVTDCAAFKQTTSKKDVPRDVAQWIMYIQDFTYVIEHRAGNRLKHVDGLSRYPVDVMVILSDISARIAKLQQEDEGVKAISIILTSGPYGDYKMKGGVLYKNVGGIDLLLVPKSMEVEVIQNGHEHGHFSAQKTIHRIQQQYFIPHLEKKVNQFLSNCIKCIIHNKKLGKREGFLNCIDKGEVPLHTLHVDHLGPMDSTSKLYKYIFAAVDAFSKFIWLFPTKSTGAEEVVRNLKIWSDVFGYPLRIISDKGAAFTSNIFADFCNENNIEQVLTTTGVARGNGQIERVNRSIISIIAKLSSEDTSKWYKYVGQVQKAINSCIHSSTKSSPFEIMFGVRMNTDVSDNILNLLQEELISSFNKERENLRAEVKQQIIKTQQQYKKNYDKKCKQQSDYKVGDLVAIKRTQFVAGKKLASEFLGPYRVTNVKRNNRYDVEKVGITEGPNRTSTSCDNMKLWRFAETNHDLLSSGSDEEQDGRM